MEGSVGGGAEGKVGRREGECGQTGDSDSMGGGHREGRGAGRGNLKEELGGHGLCFCRGHTKKRNGMVNLAQQRTREKSEMS